MILNRLGNKTKIAKDIICHFPKHDTYIDMFFGAGGIFFNKPLAHRSICNDLDDDVFNLWQVFAHDRDKLLSELHSTPICDSLFQHWRKNKEVDPIKRAIRFLMLSNFGYMGKPETLCIGKAFPKKILIEKILKGFTGLNTAQFMHEDFRKVLGKIQKACLGEKAFIYADPPYLGTDNNYQSGFIEKDTIDLFDVLVNSGVKFALSEFDNPIILSLAKSHNLEVVTIGERQNMKNKRTEILVVNYESPALYSLFHGMGGGYFLNKYKYLQC